MTNKLTFYATIDASNPSPHIPVMPLMLPASSWARFNLRTPRFPAGAETAADCGGFVATKIWGDYKYSPDQYVDWLERWGPTWAATMDYCCEPELAQVTRDRQLRTTEMAHLFWDRYAGRPWTWVPTVQGYHPHEYERHAAELAPLIQRMRHQAGFRVGIGTLCARKSLDQAHEIVDTVSRILPGIPLHLWGIKIATLKHRPLPASVVSIDSAAYWWEIYRRRPEQKASGMSISKFVYTVVLPDYARRVQHHATHTPAQLALPITARKDTT